MFRTTDTGLDRVVTTRELRTLFRSRECWRSNCREHALATSLACEGHDRMERENTTKDRERGMA